MSRFIDPTTDFGFKKIFGDEANKDIIISFLTDVLELEAPLLDIQFLNKKQLPEFYRQRSGIYDIFCKDVEGNRFVVEMQKDRLPYIKDRMVYYSTFPIAAQAKKGQDFLSSFDATVRSDRVKDSDVMTFGKKRVKTNWDYYLNNVYCIAVSDFSFDGSIHAVNRNSLRNDKPPYQLFYDKLQFITIELPLFNETRPEYNLDIHLNKWLYFLSYLPELEGIPKIFEGDAIFQKAFRVAEIANFSENEWWQYFFDRKQVWDSYALFKARYLEAAEKGEKKGIEIGEKKGEIKGKIDALLILLSQKFGSIAIEIENKIKAMENVHQLNDILAHIFEINDWESLKKYLPDKKHSS